MIRAYRQQEGERDADAWLGEVLNSEQTEQEEEQDLYCFVCGSVITQTRQRIRVDGTHKHTFTNPGGYLFEIGCFREASGCQQAGEFTDFYSWFDGYAWRYAICSACRVHLGWVFQGNDRFYGLVLNRLVSSKESFPTSG